jgi:tyrosine-protein phosphatase SIW14
VVPVGRALKERSGRRPRTVLGGTSATAGIIALVLLTVLLVAWSGPSLASARPDKPPRPQTWAQPVPSATLKNWYKVDDNVYRSEQPTREGFKEIRAKGIKTIINLRFEHSDAALVEGLDLVLIEVRMTAWDFSEDDVLRALKAIESAPKPVLIHCQHGSDRVGGVVAMYRIVFLNWPKEEALAEMRHGGFGFHWYYLGIPYFIKRADVARIRERLGLARVG